MESENLDTDKTSVSMTWDQWSHWVDSQHIQEGEEDPDPMWPNAMYDTFRLPLDQTHSEEIFSRISESPILRARFLHWPKSAQRDIANILSASWDPISVGIRYALRERLQALHPDVMDWIASDYQTVMMFGHVDVAGPQSDEFEYVHTEFADLQNIAPIPRADPSTVNEIPCLLVSLYGYERVVQAMELWMTNSSVTKLSIFVELVEKWDDFEYPREWMLNTLE